MRFSSYKALFLILACFSIASARAQQPASFNYQMFVSSLNDSIKIKYLVTSDSTNTISFCRADNRWLNASYNFQTTILWSNVPLDFNAKVMGKILSIRCSFLGNRILGYIFYFKKTRGGYQFISQSLFQQLNNGKNKVDKIPVAIKRRGKIIQVRSSME